jgi:hypothetical protein
MQLDPKGLEAALNEMAVGDEETFARSVKPAIRAYLEAAPSPSPAPGVVTALRLAVDMVERDVIRVRPSDRDELLSALSVWNAALAPLSQPAEKEERPVSYHDWLLSTSLSQPAKEREGGE